MSRVETTPVGVCSSRGKTSFEKSVVETGDIADGRTVDSTTLVVRTELNQIHQL